MEIEWQKITFGGREEDGYGGSLMAVKSVGAVER